MAKCDEGYLCDVCGTAVESLSESDLYLRYVIHEISAEELTTSPERHIRCNPVQAQFIVDDKFQTVEVDGPFSKENLDPADVQRREDLVTRGWRRLQELPGSGLTIDRYPLH